VGFESLFMAALYTALFVLAGWAFVDALFRPSASFIAAGKLTKPAWAAITGVSALVELSMTPFAVFAFPLAGFLFLPAIVAAVVYLVDVRPAVRGLRRGNSW